MLGLCRCWIQVFFGVSGRAIVVSATADLLLWEVCYGSVGFDGGGLSLDLGLIVATHGLESRAMVVDYTTGLYRWRHVWARIVEHLWKRPHSPLLLPNIAHQKHLRSAMEGGKETGATKQGEETEDSTK